MESTLLATILSSTLMAGLVSAGVTLYTGRKKNMIDHITSERKAWRAEIRELAVDIEKANTKEALRKPLAKLKVRINAFGIQDKDKLHDSAVWKIIDELKGADDSRIPVLKEILLRLLSCVLKYDWDRSKSEIRGNMTLVLSTVLQIVAVVVAVIAYLINPENNDVTFFGKLKELEYFVMPILANLFIYFYFYTEILPVSKKYKNIISPQVKLVSLFILLGMALVLLRSSGLILPWLLAFASFLLILNNCVKDWEIPDRYKQTVDAIMKDECQDALLSGKTPR